MYEDSKCHCGKYGVEGVVVPVYKGGGKDPMKTDSYRGITLTSTVAKVLEFLLLEHLESIFLEAGLPHVNQKRSVVWGCRVCYAGSDCQVSQRW